MILKYNLELSSATLVEELKKITNKIYKLLPMREEAEDWQKPLATIIEEITGLQSLLNENKLKLFTLICKLEGLFSLKEENNFFLFRRTIFDCLNLIGELIKYYGY